MPELPRSIHHQKLQLLHDEKDKLLKDQLDNHKMVQAFFLYYSCARKKISSSNRKSFQKLFSWLWDSVEEAIVWLEQLRSDIDDLDLLIISEKEKIKEIQKNQFLTDYSISLLKQIQKYNGRLLDQIFALQKDPFFRESYKEGYYYNAVVDFIERSKPFAQSQGKSSK